jgi:PIN like domain
MGHDGTMAPCEGNPDHQSRDQPQLEASGLYDGFEAYRTPTESDYRVLLTRGLVVPDTNVFLNLYRYNEQTRDDLFSVMHSLGDRLWVPNWVMKEFWCNRENVLQDPRDTAVTEKALFSSRDRACETVRGWANRVGLRKDRIVELTATLERAFDTVVESVRQLADVRAAEFARDTNKDVVLSKLEPLLHGRIGPPFTRDEYKKALADAKERFEERRPPGYKDAGKGTDNAPGDYLVWRQVLLEVRSRQQQNVLIVTGDVKEDWWRKERGELRGPRPELVQELKEFAGARLFMLRPETLLLQARQILRIKVHDESLQDVERVDREWEDWEDNDGAAPLDIDIIRSEWNMIVDQVRSVRRIAWMLLRNSLPTNFDGSSLTVEFESMGDAKGFSSSGCDRDLAETIYRLFGENVHIEVSHAGVPLESER